MAKPKYWTPEDEITFNVLNKEMIKRLQKKGKIKLPKKKIAIPKDMAWNLKVFKSELLHGIQSGYSMKKIAEAIFPEISKRTPKDDAGIIAKNKQASIRNARTMVTGAENQGRLDSYEELDEQGVVQKKVWIATPDDRTRESHLEIDGEEVDIDDRFSNGLQYPGDPSGPPEEVWNCRCSMRTHIVGFRRSDGSISRVQRDRDTTMHSGQMQEEKQRRTENAKSKH